MYIFPQLFQEDWERPSKWFSPTLFFPLFPSLYNKMSSLAEVRKHRDISIVCSFVIFSKAVLCLCKHDSFLHSEKCLSFDTEPSLQCSLLLIYSSSCTGGWDITHREMQHIYVMCKCMSLTLTLKIFKIKTHISCTLRYTLQTHTENQQTSSDTE